jgi:EPS-associated MarR family transcriptional regulator
MTPEQQAQFRLLKTLEQHPEYSQRELANAIGMSLGQTNFILHALVEKGFLKLGKFLKADKKLSKTVYLLTPTGMRQRIELTRDYVERKKVEYAVLKQELDALQWEVPEAFVESHEEQK